MVCRVMHFGVCCVCYFRFIVVYYVTFMIIVSREVGAKIFVVRYSPGFSLTRSAIGFGNPNPLLHADDKLLYAVQ